MNASQMEAKFAYIKLNNPTPFPPRGAVPVNTRMRFKVLSLTTPDSLSVRVATAPAMSVTGNQKRIGDARRLFNTGDLWLLFLTSAS
jgi:hypothetical protein